MSGRRERLASALLITLIICVLACDDVVAQEDSVPEEPTLIVRITPLQSYLQEEIVQAVRVISPHPFEELVLDLPPVEGAEIITLQQPRTRKFETYGGEGYIYETRRAIFPTRSGELLMPTIRVSGSVGIGRSEKTPFVLRHETIVMDVRPPPASFGADWWLAAREIDIKEVWSKPLETLRVGDRVSRQIEVTASGATGAHLPEPEQGRSTGLTVLPGRIERSTEITPSGVIGRLRRAFDIRIDSEQPINISPVRVVWWNTGDGKEQRTAAPAVRLEPLPRDVEALVANAMSAALANRENSLRVLLIIGGVACLLIIGCTSWLLRSLFHERPEDRRLRQALFEHSDPIDVQRALKTWADGTFPNERPMTMETLGARLGPEARRQIDKLQKAAFGRSADRSPATDLALDVLRIAQERRRRKQAGIVEALTVRLLGPERRLPTIDS